MTFKLMVALSVACVFAAMNGITDADDAATQNIVTAETAPEITESPDTAAEDMTHFGDMNLDNFTSFLESKGVSVSDLNWDNLMVVLGSIDLEDLNWDNLKNWLESIGVSVADLTWENIISYIESTGVSVADLTWENLISYIESTGVSVADLTWENIISYIESTGLVDCDWDYIKNVLESMDTN